ncbi:hypothetical protein ILUMI_19572 [Ignelater luminosus]|uniref:Uncharacterized protein n=1 Tax=Ignelater luminosus TaxID=2038154 RepID=A0A8K0CK88_IGNLU|nr:hypothetical protein ILUMI_19572 [Ignelater luminosus]
MNRFLLHMLTFSLLIIIICTPTDGMPQSTSLKPSSSHKPTSKPPSSKPTTKISSTPQKFPKYKSTNPTVKPDPAELQRELYDALNKALDLFDIYAPDNEDIVNLAIQFAQESNSVEDIAK